MTWLLVEDDNDIRNVVAVMISVWGERPLPFPDGNAAWKWLDSVNNGTFAGELPDLALLDIRMPGYTGDKVAARIRQTASIKDIPIILMTAFALTDAEIRTMIDDTGVDLLLNKPLPDMDDFRTTLFRVRDERRALNAAKLARSQAAPPAPIAPTAPTAAPASVTSAPATSASASPAKTASTTPPPVPATPPKPVPPVAPPSPPTAPTNTPSQAAPVQPVAPPRKKDGSS